jgi:hypothetical protein
MANAPTPQAAHHDAHARHETTDVNVRGVFIFGAGLLATAAVVHLLVWALFAYFTGREAERPRVYPLAAESEQRLPPEPRLQTDPREDLRRLREAEDAVLTSYGWIDRDAGIVRIPIEEAMRLTVERGLPVRPQSVTDR